jgi:hypothetical protein
MTILRSEGTLWTDLPVCATDLMSRWDNGKLATMMVNVQPARLGTIGGKCIFIKKNYALSKSSKSFLRNEVYLY